MQFTAEMSPARQPPLLLREPDTHSPATQWLPDCLLQMGRATQAELTAWRVGTWPKGNKPAVASETQVAGGKREGGPVIFLSFKV